MSWRDELLPASFRGVTFGVDGTQLSGGRKTVTHEYPMRDEAFVEDLGRRGRTFSIDAFLVGATYLTQLNALLAELEKPGPGPLVHPFHGTRLVAVTGEYRVSHGKDAGGMVTVSISFAETAEEAFSPAKVTSPTSKLEASTATAHTASGNDFVASWSNRLALSGGAVVGPGALTKPLPQFTFNSLTGLIQNAGAALHRALAPAIKGTSQIAEFKRDLDALIQDASTLARDPVQLVARLGSIFANFRQWPATPRLGLTALISVYGFVAATARPMATTATRTREQLNYDATDGLIRRGILIEAAFVCGDCAAVPAGGDLATGTTITTAPSADAVEDSTDGFETYDEAITFRDVILAAIDEQLEAVGDEAFAALTQVRADVTLAVPGEVNTLPRLVTDTPIETVPVLVEAYRLYGSIGLADDIVSRNRIRHPGFVPGGRTMQVLSHG